MKLLDAFEIVNNLSDEDLEFFKESYQERFAIMVYDGGLDESSAMLEAFKCVFINFFGNKDGIGTKDGGN